MAAIVITTELEEMDESECWDLLAQVTIGRLGLHFGAMPRIVPMNFTLFDRRIVVCTASGTAVTDALRDSVVAFQVDDFHLSSQERWSVVAVGPSAWMTGLWTHQAVDGFLTEPLALGQRHCYTEIEPRLISGRRFRTADARHKHAGHGGGPS
jgi:uncharacterized protein